ncbi:MAG TPA: hypothetical protein VE567_09790 [Sphingomonas sp.]|nr:hypothetical protein [Sphingomonas sp.]
MADWKRRARPVRPDFATLVAVAAARQSASPTAQVLAAAEAGPVSAVSLVELFADRRKGALVAASFNSGVAALLTVEKGM